MAEYQEFTEPVDPKTGEPMSEEKRKKYKAALLARENPTSRLIRDLPRASQFLRETVGDVKRRTKEVAGDIGEFGAAAAEGVGEAIKAPFEYRAALATDPKGTMAATKEFGSRVMSGDPKARRQTAEGVSMSMVEPFATAADAELARQDLAKGDYTGAAISGASVLLPFVSAGWLKTAMRKGDVPSEAAEKVAELERRVDAGEVTDDMQIRRELAMIEDAHALDYAKSRPVEDPMQRGMSRPDPEVDLEGAAEFDRGLDQEPPGYMHMSRSNQPMSRFSEGHARFIDELRTDMTEDTNFGELSSRFYNDLESIDKREDLLRSTGKDARGRQLDDVQITNEYEKLSKERQALANEYYVAKAEREAELRSEGSYVPRGGPGGERKSAFEPFPEYVPSPTGITSESTKRQIDDVVSKVKETSDRLKGRAPGSGSARSRIDRFAPTPDAKAAVEYDARLRGLSVDQFLDELEEFEMDREIYTRDAFYGDEESGGKLFQIGERYIEAANVDDAIRLATNEDGFEHYMYHGVLRDGPPFTINTDDDLRRLIVEASPEESAKYFQLKRQGGSIRGQARDIHDYLRQLYYARRTKSGQYRMHTDFDEYENEFLEKLSGRLRDNPELEKELRRRATSSPQDFERLFSKLDSSPRGGRGIDDLEGPSEEEIRSMVAQDQASALKYGDPEEYAMMMEDLRRGLAQAQQEGVERARARTTRTPGTPAASGKVPEGSSRGKRRGPTRERPKKK